MIRKSRCGAIFIVIVLIVSCIVNTTAFSTTPKALWTASPVTFSALPKAVVFTQPKRTSTPSSLSMRNNGENDMSTTERALSCLPYILPLLDGDRYGRFIFAIFPTLGALDYILLGPLKAIYTSIPFLNLAVFILLTSLARNTEIPRSVRYNMQQAVVVDILLIFPSLLGQISGGVAPQFLVEAGSNFVFYALVATVGYAVVSNASGRIPDQIPVVSEAVDIQIGPF